MNVKPLFVTLLAVAGLTAAILLPTHSRGEVGPDDPAFAALLRDVTVQQAAIADNQAKIDEKLAAITEDVRLARIFAGRGR